MIQWLNNFMTLKMSRVNLIKKFQSSVIDIVRNKSFWLDFANHVISFNQSDCIISD